MCCSREMTPEEKVAAAKTPEEELASKKRRAHHAAEAIRIAGELDNLGPGYAEDGIIRTVLRARVKQETRRAKLDHCDCGYCGGGC